MSQVAMSLEVRLTRRARLYLWLASWLASVLAKAIAASGVPCRVSVDIDEDRIILDRFVKIPGVTK